MLHLFFQPPVSPHPLPAVSFLSLLLNQHPQAVPLSQSDSECLGPLPPSPFRAHGPFSPSCVRRSSSCYPVFQSIDQRLNLSVSITQILPRSHHRQGQDEEKPS